MALRAAQVRRLLNQVVTLACATAFVVPPTPGRSAPVEPPIIPTVHPVLAPGSAIHLPMVVNAKETYVWRSNSEQRMFLRGDVMVQLGYRTLRANQAAIFLTPTKDAGESTFDVAIYLSEGVRVEEGNAKASTATNTNELLVTSRISGSVHLGGSGNPVAQKMDDNAVVRRGDDLRMELLTKPAPIVYIPTITITDKENALQRGWIAQGPGNRIIAGPGEGLAGSGIGGAKRPGGPASTEPGEPKEPKDAPQIFATADKQEYNKQVGDERVHLLRGAFYLRITEPTKPAFELRAERAVMFAPKAAETRGDNTLAQVTGVYLEGDVSLEYGNFQMRAERLYYDFLSNRVIILDGVMTTVDEERNIPMVLRAEELRGYNVRDEAAREFAAKSVKFSTSEFHTPHYHIGASNTYLQPIDVVAPTPREEEDKPSSRQVYAYRASDVTMNFAGVPVFWWPYVSGNTAKDMIPLRKITASYSKRYGLSVETSWHLFGLAGVREPKGVDSVLHIDYFGERGPGGGVDTTYDRPNMKGSLKTYIIDDRGDDNLGRDRDDLKPLEETRGRAEWRHKQQLDENWSLQLQAAYVSDPAFVEQFYPNDFFRENEPETSIYLKRQEDTQALTLLGKWSLYDFTTVANRIDDQFVTEKSPELKYYRIGDNLFDIFTYYSESGVASVNMMMSDFDPARTGLGMYFPNGQTIRDYYKTHGWTGGNVFRTDTRHELNMPIHIGSLNVTPYISGRFSSWDEDFPDQSEIRSGDIDYNGSTTRVWGTAGVRGSMAFWRVYDDVNSEFWDLHRIRHVIEPQFNVYATGSNYQASELQPFDPDVEEISRASGAGFNLHQKWQTRRGGPGHWRMVDWLVFNIGYNGFWNADETGPYALQNDARYNNRRYLVYNPLRGFMYTSRPELSQVANTVNTDASWRMGEWARLLGEVSYNTDTGKVHQFATGVVIDHTKDLSYFIGNRFVQDAEVDANGDNASYNSTDEWTISLHYQLTRKYSVALTQSYDFQLKENILTSGTLLRRFPRLNTAITVGYDATTDDTSIIFSAWPEGFNNVRVGGGNAAGPFGGQ